MAVKKCCIENCNSCSTRKEDVGVTYHKYPKTARLQNIWIKVTQYKNTNTDSPAYVCSRHFRKTDFQLYEDSKYALKSGAIPTIFPWAVINTESKKMEFNELEEDNDNINNTSSSTKESEAEDVDAIKKFIEEEEECHKEVSLEEKCMDVESRSEIITRVDANETIDVVKATEEIAKPEDNAKNTGHKEKNNQSETMSVATSVLDMILCESENRLERKKDVVPSTHLSASEEKGNGSVSLKVGSKVEAKDFCEDWYPAQIVEVDFDEMEVLVRYENASKKHDEWISVSSPRLRPLRSLSKPPIAPSIDLDKSNDIHNVRDDMKTEEKIRLTYVVGERCLARWRDNRRFVATVHKVLENGSYEVIFDDGFHWACKGTRLYKMKQSSVMRDSLKIDTSIPGPSASTPSPTQYGAGPLSAPQVTPYHTHLFDPTRDYLGSKTERREMKRKLNIKEIFNIGQKRRKKIPKVTDAESGNQETVKRKYRKQSLRDAKKEVKLEIPDAVASIIGTIERNNGTDEEIRTVDDNIEPSVSEEKSVKIENDIDTEMIESNKEKPNIDVDPVIKEETKLEKFEIQDNIKHEEFIDKMKEVITKLEDGINKVENLSSPKPEVQQNEVKDIADRNFPQVETSSADDDNIKQSKPKEDPPKIKKSKKLKLSQQKKVKRQVEKVKCELEEMKKQMEVIKKQMLLQTEELIKSPEMPESFLLPGEWCAKWVNGQPVGVVSEIESETKVDANNKPALPRRSVQVEDKRLPPGWTKHMVRRSFGHSAGKWDVVLVSPNNRRFHTKTEMKNYFENNPEDLTDYEHALMDFGVHIKLSRRMGWVKESPNTDNLVVPQPAELLSSTSPLVKRRKLNFGKSGVKIIKKKRKLKRKSNPETVASIENLAETSGPSENQLIDASLSPVDSTFDNSNLEDGYVYVGSLKVQIIENLLRCPAEGCFKNFRNNTLLQMHIKHYHRELKKLMGATPKVLDLAYARTTMPEETEIKKEDSKVIKVKVVRPQKRSEELKQEPKEIKSELKLQLTPIKIEPEKVPRSQDSPKLRHALVNKPVKRPKVLLPVRRPEKIEVEPEVNDDIEIEHKSEIIDDNIEIPGVEVLDFETAISTHTVTKPINEKKKKADKKKSFAVISKKAMSEDDDWFGINSDVETMSSFPRSGTPDSKTMDSKIEQPPACLESSEDQKDASMYTYTENGERIKIVHMKREEIINCHCGFREEDGLMVQCELCLCWQHAMCHNIHTESEVPEKYTCSICLNPRRGRRSRRFVHDQDRVYEGLLPGAGARPEDALRRTHDLSGNLVRIHHALHALRVKYYVATKKDHPKLYLWAKDWENGELNSTPEKLQSAYSDLNVMMSDIGKENLPMKPEEMRDMSMDSQLSEEPDADRYSHKEGHLGSHSLLSGFLSSPGGASLDLPISTSELERLAKSVQAEELPQRVVAPQPEAPIENSACRERLLRHIQRCQALIDARLDSIDAQIAELESQDPSFEDDETADYFPRTKQTIQMLLRDLDTMEELGIIT